MGKWIRWIYIVGIGLGGSGGNEFIFRLNWVLVVGFFLEDSCFCKKKKLNIYILYLRFIFFLLIVSIYNYNKWDCLKLFFIFGFLFFFFLRLFL